MNTSTSPNLPCSLPAIGTCIDVMNGRQNWSELELQQRANNAGWLVREAEACVVLAAGYDDAEWIARRLQSAIWRLWDIENVEQRVAAFNYLRAFVPDYLQNPLRDAEQYAIDVAGSTILSDGTQDEEQLVRAELELMDLSPIERAIFDAAFRERHLSEEEIAAKVGSSPEFVRQTTESFFERTRVWRADSIMLRVVKAGNNV